MLRSTHCLLLLAVSTVVCACAIEFPSDQQLADPDVVGTVRAPLIGGDVTEPGEDESVVALTSNGFPVCSGTLISPRVVLTAAHCIDMGRDGSVHFGNDVNMGGRKVGVEMTRTHPDWPKVLGQGFDIGVMLLSAAQDPALVVPMNRSDIGDHIGDPIRTVGFGVFDRGEDSDGVKRQGTTSIIRLGGDDIMMIGDANVGVCFGDSGGPGLLEIEGVEHVAGVHSFTMGSNCSPPMGDTRVDLHVEDFLQPWIDENDPSCGEDFLCDEVGCTDDPDCEPCGPNGECLTDCPLPDPDCATQMQGEVCQVDTQCLEGVCVWWVEDPGTRFCADECNDSTPCPSGMSCQNRPEVGSVCYYDDHEDVPGTLGSECAGDADCGSRICLESTCVKVCDLGAGQRCPTDFTCETLDSSNFYCFPPEPESGGCAAADGLAASPVTLGAGLLLLLTACFLARRRQRAR